MVVLKFYKDAVLIGAKEFLTDEKAEEVGMAWLKKAHKLFPDHIYHFDMLQPIYLIEGKKTLGGEKTYQRFNSISKALCSSNKKPKIQLIFRSTRFTGKMPEDWEGDLII